MSYLVYQMRFCSRLEVVDEPRERKALRALLRERRAAYLKLRKAIASELRRAETNGEIAARGELEDVVRHFANDGDEISVITTNWDTTVDAVVRRIVSGPRVFHLHGSARRGARLYLPSEVIDEPYRLKAERKALGLLAGTFMRALGGCERVVVYGLSFDPLDAELGLLTADAFVGTDNPKEVIVVDTNPQPVAKRLLALLTNSPKITCRRVPT